MAVEPKYRLTNIEVEEISLVDRPANRRRILIKKAEDIVEGGDAGGANQVGGEAVEGNVGLGGGDAIGDGQVVAFEEIDTAPGDVEKAMPEEISAARLEDLTPRDDMTDEELREQLAARSREFGIEALDSAPLRFQADRPRDLKKYGDPTNLGYPADTEARARNALARGRQNIPSAYSQERSRALVWERIVRAAMEYGIEHPFDPDDELDALLPAELRGELEEMMVAATKKKMAALFAAAVQAAETGAAAAAAARVDKLERALAAERRRSAALEKQLAVEPTRPAALIKEHTRVAGEPFSWGIDLTLELDK